MKLITISIVIFPWLVAGCNLAPIQTNPDIGIATKELSDKTAALQAIAKLETDAKVTVRRDEAIRYWLARGDDSNKINITSANPRESFARYVCAGTGALNNANAQVAYFSAYSNAAQAAVEPGPDTLAGQFARFIDQSKPNPTIKLPVSEKKADQLFIECVGHTNDLLSLYDAGHTAADTSDEFQIDSITTLLDAGQALVNSLEKIAKDGLKVINDIQARAHLKRLINENRQGLENVESTFISKGQLDEAWNRRAAFVLGTGYEKFAVMLADRKRISDHAKLRAAGLEVSNTLSAYDAMMKTKKPSDVARSWTNDAKVLDKAVNDDKVSISAIISYTKATAEQAKTIEDDYKEATAKFDTLLKTLAEERKK
jgi:hypothetical protein